MTQKRQLINFKSDLSEYFDKGYNYINSGQHGYETVLEELRHYLRKNMYPVVSRKGNVQNYIDTYDRIIGLRSEFSSYLRKRGLSIGLEFLDKQQEKS